MFRRALLVSALALMLSMSACADDSSEPPTTAAPTTTTEPSAFPREVLGVEIPTRPARIVSASASHTEILYALDAGDRIVATDLFSNYPPAASETDKIDAFNVNVEAVAVFEPDLVILSFDPGDVVDGLGELGIPALMFTAPATLGDAYAQMEALGAALGSEGEAADLVAGIRADIGELVDVAPPGGDRPTFYHELDNSYFTITSATFIGSVYMQVGMENIADPVDETGFGYPQLSAEYIIEADPDFIFLADTLAGESAATVAERPGWDTLSAVRNGRVIELDDDVASRWGPRIVEFLETVVSNVYETAR